MKHIVITGPMPAAAELASRRYAEHAEAGLHVLMDAPGEMRNNLPERRISAAEVLVSVTQAPGEIQETITDCPK